MTRAGELFASDAEIAWEAAGQGVRRKVLCYDGGIMLVRVAFEKGGIGAEHSHPHLQCSVVESGVFDVTIAGRTQRLSAGDSYFVPANALHSAVAIEAGVLVDAFTPMREDFVQGG